MSTRITALKIWTICLVAGVLVGCSSQSIDASLSSQPFQASSTVPKATPQEVADKLFQGIRNEKFYIPTDHLIFLRKNVKIRMEAILRNLQKD